MANIIDINLETLNTTELKNLAKEYKVKNWWNLKKAELLENLTLIQEEEKEEEHLTEEDIQEAVEKASKELGIKAPETKADPKTKAPKKEKVEKNDANLVTLKELASEFHMKGTKARRLLRNNTAARPFGGNRWEWDKELHKKELELARKVLSGSDK